MDTKTLSDIAVREVQACWLRFCDIYPQLRRDNVPAISLNNRFKTTAGMAYYDSHSIKLSTELFREHTDHFIADTIPHEVAHLVDYIVFKEWGHGPSWKQVMRAYGLEPARCHNMTNSAHEARKYK